MIRRLVAVMIAVAMTGFLVVCVPGVAAAADVKASCTLTPTSGTESHTVAGREYFLNVPAGLSGPSVPLLIALHGAAQPPLLHETDTGLSNVAKTRHFIVAYPSTRQSTWDFAQGSEDVVYLRAVVRDISSVYCVDPRRVHAEGHSSGALMAARLACDASTVFASVAVYAGADPSLTGSPCGDPRGPNADPLRPISVGIFHGNTDPISLLPFAVQHRDNWLRRNGCPATPVTEPNVVVEASAYRPCKAGVEVVWRVYRAGHLLPQGADKIDLISRMWDFFLRNPLR
ncbi:MAG: alpha/beta hydrolase family esterase [Pseudonocardiaceae bacterium]